MTNRYDIYVLALEEKEDEDLEHYGTKGMRWGVRRRREAGGRRGASGSLPTIAVKGAASSLAGRAIGQAAAKQIIKRTDNPVLALVGTLGVTAAGTIAAAKVLDLDGSLRAREVNNQLRNERNINVSRDQLNRELDTRNS